MLFIFCFYTFYLILENMSTNVRKFQFPCYIWHLWVDVVYNLSISLLPPIVLDNLFEINERKIPLVLAFPEWVFAFFVLPKITGDIKNYVQNLTILILLDKLESEQISLYFLLHWMNWIKPDYILKTVE